MRPAFRLRLPPFGTPARPFVSPALLAFAAATVLACAPARAPGQSPPTRIPTLSGTTLTGVPVCLPASLRGKVGILVLGFSRESRVPAAAWGQRLAADFDHTPDIVYFELPVLEDVPRFLRGVVLRAIAHDLSPPAQTHFLPLTANEAQWKSAARFAQPDAAYVLVVDSSGEILWQTSGDATDERYTSLRRVVAAARPHPSAPAP